jgi:ABC-2 type transport system permease protein
VLAHVLSDLRLYQRLVVLQLRTQAQYKLNVFVDIGASFAMTCLEFFGIWVYFGTFPSMLGWKVGEVALLYGLMSMSFGMAELFGAGIDMFPEMIRLGDFDRMLLRPAAPLMLVVGSDFRLRRLGRISQGIVTFCFALYLLPNLHWTWLKLIVLTIGIASGALIFISILLLGATLCFWTVETTELTNILTYGGREMLSYPLAIYNQTLQRIFLFVVPLAFGSYVPACYILGRPLPFGLPSQSAFGAPVIALLFAWVTRLIWDFGVRHYQSTGS